MSQGSASEVTHLWFNQPPVFPVMQINDIFYTLALAGGYRSSSTIVLYLPQK